MIIDLNQILSIFNIDYEIVKENNKLGGASLPKQFNQGGEIKILNGKMLDIRNMKCCLKKKNQVFFIRKQD